MQQVITPDGIMYLKKIENDIAYCYDDQSGKELQFLKEEISYYHPLFPAHKFSIEPFGRKEKI